MASTIFGSNQHSWSPNCTDDYCSILTPATALRRRPRSPVFVLSNTPSLRVASFVVSIRCDSPDVFGMSSSSQWRSPPNAPSRLSDDRIDRSGHVNEATRHSVSFARDKFVWLDQVRADPALTPLAFMIAYVLANLVNEREGYAWPSIARLAADCRVTERGVQRIIRGLVECGHLSVESGIGRGETNRYRWIVKNDNGAPRIENARGADRQCGCNGEPPPSSEGRTRVHPIDLKRVNHGSEKGEQPFEKGRTAVHPTLFNESIYDLAYRLPSQRKTKVAASAFDAFWRAYPKKVALTEAMRALARATERAPPDEIIRGAARYAAERDGEDPRYTKHPATWLNKACWRDQPSTSRAFPRDGPAQWPRTNRSIVAQLHDDDDFDEVLARIQNRHDRRD